MGKKLYSESISVTGSLKRGGEITNMIIEKRENIWDRRTTLRKKKEGNESKVSELWKPE
jgi:hypothetical protein